MKTLNDLCPGFIAGKTGQGRCCCGLHWVGEIPAHDENMRPLPLDRLWRRHAEANAAELRRHDDRLYFARHGVPLPVGWLGR
jgi:hypothetical protein